MKTELELDLFSNVQRAGINCNQLFGFVDRISLDRTKGWPFDQRTRVVNIGTSINLLGDAFEDINITILHLSWIRINSFIYAFIYEISILISTTRTLEPEGQICRYLRNVRVKIFVGMEKIFAMKVCGCVVRSWWQQNSWWQRHKSAWLRSDSRHAVTWTRHDVCLIKWCRDTWIHDTWDTGWGAVVEGWRIRGSTSRSLLATRNNK